MGDAFKFAEKTNTVNKFVVDFPKVKVLVLGEGEYDRITGAMDEAAAMSPARVYLNEPYVVTIWGDETKDVLKCGEDDVYDPLFGIIFNAMHKVTRNKVRVKSWEPVISFLADNLVDADECRIVAETLLATAECLDVDGVMGAIGEYDKRTFESEPPAGDGPSGTGFVAVDTIRNDYASKTELEEMRESLRAELRDLIDRGEI